MRRLTSFAMVLFVLPVGCDLKAQMERATGHGAIVSEAPGELDTGAGSATAFVFPAPTRALMLSSSSQLLESRDDGQSWSVLSQLPSGTRHLTLGEGDSLWVTGVFSDPPEKRINQSGSVCISDVAVSRNGGATFRSIDLGSIVSCLLELVELEDNDPLLLDTNGRLWRHASRADTASSFKQVRPPDQNSHFSAACISNDSLFVTTSMVGFFSENDSPHDGEGWMSTDWGDNWVRLFDFQAFGNSFWDFDFACSSTGDSWGVSELGVVLQYEPARSTWKELVDLDEVTAEIEEIDPPFRMMSVAATADRAFVLGWVNDSFGTRVVLEVLGDGAVQRLGTLPAFSVWELKVDINGSVWAGGSLGLFKWNAGERQWDQTWPPDVTSAGFVAAD